MAESITVPMVREMVLQALDMTREVCDEELLVLIDEVVLRESRKCYMNANSLNRLRRDVFNSLRRYDCLQELLEEPGITEIMVNGGSGIYYEREGRIAKSELRFESEERLGNVVQKIAAVSNRIVNESTPIVDARLEDGSRVSMVLPPVAINGPIVTIRRFPKETMTMEKLRLFGAVSEEAIDYLRTLVEAGYNIFVSGGTGAGKTSFLNALSEFIPKHERLITIEDSAELQIRGVPNLVRLEARNANLEGRNSVTIRDLIKASLRMRPDRIIVGEVRDAAAIDMLQALSTGHSGMSTGHATSPQDMMLRLETLVLLGEDIPLPAVRRQVASALDIIVQLSRYRDGSRKVKEIVEVYESDTGDAVINPLFRYEITGFEEGKVIGSLERTKNRLVKREKLYAAGIGNEEAY